MDERTHRTSEIAPDDGFYGDDFGFLHKHCPSLELVPVLLHFFRHLVNIGCDEVVWDDMLELSKPEQGYAREQLPLFWDALWNRSAGRKRMAGRQSRTFFRMTSYTEILSVATNRRRSSDEVT